MLDAWTHACACGFLSPCHRDFSWDFLGPGSGLAFQSSTCRLWLDINKITLCITQLTPSRACLRLQLCFTLQMKCVCVCGRFLILHSQEMECQASSLKIFPTVLSPGDPFLTRNRPGDLENRRWSGGEPKVKVEEAGSRGAECLSGAG